MVEGSFCGRVESGKDAKKVFLLCMGGFGVKVRGVAEVHNLVSVGICTQL